MAIFNLPNIQVVSSSGEINFTLDPLVRYNVKVYLNNSSVNCMITLYDNTGAKLQPFTVLAASEIAFSRVDYQKILFSDTNTYNIYYIVQKVQYESEQDMNCVIPDVSLSVFQAGLAQDTSVTQVKTALGSPLQDIKIPSPLELDSGGAIYHVLKTDLVGLFKAGQAIAQSPFTLATDAVGLLKDTKIPQALGFDTNGNLLQSLNADPQSFFTKIKNLALDGTNNLLQALNADNVGLFRQNQNIGQIVSPITARSMIAAGYQESVLYFNYGTSGDFMSGSSADSSNNQLIADATISNVLNTTTGTFGQTTVFIRFQIPASTNGAYIYSTAANGNSGHSERIAIYSDNAGSIGTLLKDFGTFNAFPAIINDTTTLLAAGSYYWLAFSQSVSNELYYASTGGTNNVAYSTTSYYNSGFPSTLTPTGSSTTGTITTNTTLNLVFNVSLTYSLLEVGSTTFNGQQILHVALFNDTSQSNASIKSINFTTKGATAGTIRTATLSNQSNIALSALVDIFLADAGNVNSGNPITLNAGDTFEVLITLTLIGNAGHFYIDNLNGVSYVVMPLQ